MFSYIVGHLQLPKYCGVLSLQTLLHQVSIDYSYQIRSAVQLLATIWFDSIRDDVFVRDAESMSPWDISFGGNAWAVDLSFLLNICLLKLKQFTTSENMPCLAVQPRG